MKKVDNNYDRSYISGSSSYKSTKRRKHETGSSASGRSHASSSSVLNNIGSVSRRRSEGESNRVCPLHSSSVCRKGIEGESNRASPVQSSSSVRSVVSEGRQAKDTSPLPVSSLSPSFGRRSERHSESVITDKVIGHGQVETECLKRMEREVVSRPKPPPSPSSSVVSGASVRSKSSKPLTMRSLPFGS